MSVVKFVDGAVRHRMGIVPIPRAGLSAYQLSYSNDGTWFFVQLDVMQRSFGGENSLQKWKAFLVDNARSVEGDLTLQLSTNTSFVADRLWGTLHLNVTGAPGLLCTFRIPDETFKDIYAWLEGVVKLGTASAPKKSRLAKCRRVGCRRDPYKGGLCKTHLSAYRKKHPF